MASASLGLEGRVNIAAHLPAVAALQPHKAAVVAPVGRDGQGRVAYSHLTYAQLDRASDELARGFEKVGLGRGRRAVLMVKPSLDFFALTFALYKVGAVPVLIDPGIGLRHLKACVGQSEPTAFIGVSRAHVARQLFGWARGRLELLVSVGRRCHLGGYRLEQIRALGAADEPYEMAETKADEAAAVLFTSGSTGPPKGVVYSHGNFAAQVENIRATYGIEPGEVDLATFPLFGLFDPALGMTTIVPDMDASRPASVDPRKIIEAIEDFGVTNMFGSPALLNRLGRHVAAEGLRLPSLRRIISAGAPMPAEVMRRFEGALAPGVEIHTPYGATESLPVCSVGSAELLGDTAAQTARGAGVCVGRPVAEVEVRVIAIEDGPLARLEDARELEPGEVGEVIVKGPRVTRSYYKREEATGLAKIEDGPGFWHRMGDLGRFDEQGRLWFCGRKSHRVELPTGTLFSVPCEQVFNVHPGVLRTALVGVEVGARREPVLCVELDADGPSVSEQSLRAELRALGAACDQTRDITRLLFHPGFPVDIRHNSKIFREKLAAWAQARV